MKNRGAAFSYKVHLKMCDLMSGGGRHQCGQKAST